MPLLVGYIQAVTIADVYQASGCSATLLFLGHIQLFSAWSLETFFGLRFFQLANVFGLSFCFAMKTSFNAKLTVYICR